MTESRIQSELGKVLVVIPCGSAKIWDTDPCQGAVRAMDAYVGFPFRVNRQFAEQFGDSWVILSAKYGFIDPGFKIPGNYDTAFGRPATGPISSEALADSLRQIPLCDVDTAIVLGGRHYRQAAALAFSESAIKLRFPFAGLPLGKAIKATRQAIATVTLDHFAPHF